MTFFSEEMNQLRTEFLNELGNVSSLKELESLKVRYLGKKGPVQSLMVGLKNCPPEEKPLFGKRVNDLKEEFLALCEKGHLEIEKKELSDLFAKEWIDPTLPGRQMFAGKSHLLTQMLDSVLQILAGMGFAIRLGPDVDTDYYNFEGLNFPPDHPARDMQDTFYLQNGCLLRTHTSNVQIHAMEEFKPPLRIVAPGRAFRNEDISARSHVFFHQVEAFYIDTHVTFADLLATLDEFLKKLLGSHTKTRFRPSYFPFVEPGMEVDISCTACVGTGCRICKHTGWLEILGSGMIHPNVLKKGKIDPEVYSGYAWGMGIERLAILQYDVSDIRLFTENDLRFLMQFP